MDLSKLTDNERELLEKMIANAEGRFLGKIIPAFIVEFSDLREGDEILKDAIVTFEIGVDPKSGKTKAVSVDLA